MFYILKEIWLWMKVLCIVHNLALDENSQPSIIVYFKLSAICFIK